MEPQNLPEILDVRDLKEYLRTGWNNAYALCRRKDFPAIRIGRTYRIPRESFRKWLEQQAGNSL